MPRVRPGNQPTERLEGKRAETDAEQAAREGGETGAKEVTCRRSQQVVHHPSVHGQHTPEQGYRSQTGTPLGFVTEQHASTNV